MKLNPDDARAFYLGAITLSRLGQKQKALEWGARALAIDPEDAGVLYNVSCLNAVGGEREAALDLLERAVRNGFGDRQWIEHDPDLSSLRDEPRFRTLLERL